VNLLEFWIINLLADMIMMSVLQSIYPLQHREHNWFCIITFKPHRIALPLYCGISFLCHLTGLICRLPVMCINKDINQCCCRCDNSWHRSHDIGQMTYDTWHRTNDIWYTSHFHTLLVYFSVCIAFSECHIMYLMISLIIALHHC